jgi:hypothetical protein
MPILVLIPGLICIIALYRTSPQRAFLNVYLPVFMILPNYYYWKVSALPPIDFHEAVLLPLGIGMIFVDLPRWRLSRSDIWLAIFVFTTYYGNHLNGEESVAIFSLFSAICLAVVPYLAGKLLIEQYDARVATLKRFVFLLFLISLISAYEYRIGRNPFTQVLDRFFPAEHFGWKTQIRWGWGRVSGPFAQSELAGIIWDFGLVLALYLGFLKRWESKFKRLEFLPLKKSTIITAIVAFTLFMTQARGPWLGCLIALPIAFVGRSKHFIRTGLLVGTFGIVFGYFGYVGIKAYTSGPITAQTSEEQENATYRATLISNYMPVVEHGGLFGWGKDFPTVGTQHSIDNEYLFLALTQGYVGLAAFCLLAFECFLHLTKPAVFGGVMHYRYFAFSLAGFIAGMLVIVATVFLFGQSYQLFFLLAGWSQSLEPRVGEMRPEEPKYQTIFT